MTFERAKDIFLAICDLNPDERQVRLAEECGDDAVLRHAVEGLLAGDARPMLGTSENLRMGLEAMLAEEEIVREHTATLHFATATVIPIGNRSRRDAGGLTRIDSGSGAGKSFLGKPPVAIGRDRSRISPIATA